MKRVRSPSGKALYRVLPRSVADMSAEQVAFHQRARLQGAIVAAVAEHGYQQVTIKQIVALAGVSLTAFYKHFESKETLFLETFDLIVSMASERIGRAYRSQDDWKAQMRASFQAYAEIIEDEPAASRLVLIDSLAAGERAVARRERASETFETMLTQSYARAPEPAPLTPLSVQMVIAGIRHIAYRRLLGGTPERLAEHTDDLLAFALAYHAPNIEPPRRAAHPKRSRKPETTPPETADQRPDGRQRILDAIVSIANKDGYAALSMPLIAKQAGTSNATFYEHFPDKQAAFLTAFWETTTRGITPSVQAFTAAETWPAAVHASITALLEQVAADETFARMAFFSILTAGRAGIDTANQALDQFATIFAPAHKQQPAIPATTSQALVGGLWATIAHELAHGRANQLPELAPELTYIVLTPFLGAQEAAEVAGGWARDT